MKWISSFINFTFEVIQTKKPHVIAAVFTFGREDLIPDIFIEILEQSNGKHKNRFPKLMYYLIRHIEVDGDEHGPAAHKILEQLIAGNESARSRAKRSAKKAIADRIQLWDGILYSIAQERAAVA